MANIKFAGEAAVGALVNNIKTKLTIASSMPSSPDINTIVLYVGTSTSSYIQGGIYQYNGTNQILLNNNSNILIDNNTIELNDNEELAVKAIPYTYSGSAITLFVTTKS